MNSARDLLTLRSLPLAWSLRDLARLRCVKKEAAQKIATRLLATGAVVRSGDNYLTTIKDLCEKPPAKAKPRPRNCPPEAAECGRWTMPTKPKPGGPLALGPTVPLYDAEGRSYAAQWAVINLADLAPSHRADSTATPGYPLELQARNRAETASRLQVEALARSFSVSRVLAPSSSPTDSAPIVWAPTDGGWFFVVSGNGRAMALRQWLTSSSTNVATYWNAILDRWHWPAAAAARAQASAMAGALVACVRIVTGTRAQAVQLAGASQATAAATETTAERATGRGRSAGVTDAAQLAALGPFRWLAPIDASTVQAFAAQNPRFWLAALGTVAADRRPSIALDDSASAQLITDLLLAASRLAASRKEPPEIRAALVGALPAAWSLHLDTADEVPPAWDLWDRLSAARAWAGKAKDPAALIARAIDATRQTGEAAVDWLAVGLGALLMRAASRAAPADAAAELAAAYVAEAATHGRSQTAMFPPTGTPIAAMGRIVRLDLVRLDAAQAARADAPAPAAAARAAAVAAAVPKAADAPAEDAPQGALATFTHSEDRLQTNVFTHPRGFSVVMRDLDSGLSVSGSRVYPDKEKAIREAQKLLTMEKPNAPAPAPAPQDDAPSVRVSRPKTFDQARVDIFAYLKAQGWTVKEYDASRMKPMIVPWAKSPNGQDTLWFKAQAVHLNAHSLFVDIRNITPQAFLQTVNNTIEIRKPAPAPAPATIASVGDPDQLSGLVVSFTRRNRWEIVGSKRGPGLAQTIALGFLFNKGNSVYELTKLQTYRTEPVNPEEDDYAAPHRLNVYGEARRIGAKQTPGNQMPDANREASTTTNPAPASWVQLGTRIDLDLQTGETLELPAGAVLVTLADFSDLSIAYIDGPAIDYADPEAVTTWRDFHDARTPGPTRAASTLDYGPPIGQIKAIRYDCQHGGQYQRRLHYFDQPLPVAFGSVKKIGIKIKNKRLRVTNRGIIG